jgi:hypothetical protein
MPILANQRKLLPRKDKRGMEGKIGRVTLTLDGRPELLPVTAEPQVATTKKTAALDWTP